MLKKIFSSFLPKIEKKEEKNPETILNNIQAVLEKLLKDRFDVERFLTILELKKELKLLLVFTPPNKKYIVEKIIKTLAIIKEGEVNNQNLLLALTDIIKFIPMEDELGKKIKDFLEIQQERVEFQESKDLVNYLEKITRISQGVDIEEVKRGLEKFIKLRGENKYLNNNALSILTILIQKKDFKDKINEAHEGLVGLKSLLM